MFKLVSNRKRYKRKPLFRTPNPYFVGDGLSLSFQSGGDINGLFYYLGTQGYTQAWVNPITSNYLQAAFFGNGSSSLPISNLTNRATSGEYVYINGAAGNLARAEFYLPRLFRITSIALKTSNSSPNMKDFRIVGWNDGGSYATATVIADFVNQNSVLNVTDTWVNFPISNETFYKNIAFVHVLSSNGDLYLRLSEIELYGFYVP